MSVRNRRRDGQHAEEAPGLAGRRDQAADLRARATAVRDQLAADERALQERRDADEAGTLERQAAALDLEQDRDDRAAELRDQADTLDATAADLDVQAEQVTGEVLDAAVRAATFEHRIAVELAGRRLDLEQRRDEAAAAGDTDTLLETERDLGLLPAVEQQLRSQAETAASSAHELNGDAARLESIADYQRRRAGLLRQHAEGDALAPLHDSEEMPADLLERGGGRRVMEYVAARGDALAAIRATPDLHTQTRDSLASVYEETRAATLRGRMIARQVAPLDPIAALVERVRDAAVREAARNGALVWFDGGRQRPGVYSRPVFPDRRRELADAVDGYRSGSGRDLPACWRLATSGEFEFASDVVDAAADALAEIDAEREALQNF